ncbi:MAG TPA: 4-alpha-glucanotransferase, partial [Chitinophagaceae bacterium]
EWREMNREITNAVDPNDEYFIYQSLTGAYPFPGETDDGFACRFKQYLEKAFREAKTHSNWVSPDNEYESAVNDFAGRLLDKHRPYWKSFTELQRKITDHGIINSLSQLVLKFTCPGIPDVYQGCETWDLSFVDPDNRRPVDFGLRAQWLSEIAAAEDDVDLFKNLWQERYTGKIKLWLTHQLFMLRKQQPELFSYGEYIPLEVEGTYRNSVIAFARKYRQSVYVIALPLHTAAICDEQGTEPLLISWKDTRIILPADVSPEWEDILLHSTERYKGEIRLKEAFALTPFMIWKGRQLVKERSAGILLHISSLPSPFGIGDLGPEARNFADFLYRAKQKYWQLLPLNPVEGGQGYSPYSAVSALAGNTLLISPELLVKDGLLDHKELSRYHLANETKVSFDAVEHSKEELIHKAFWSYLKHHHRSEFEAFCLKESYWLEDYAMFCLLKKLNQGKPWYEWNQRQRDRDEQTLGELSADHGDEIYRIKWLQYVFCRQWKQLKFYCNERNISLVGDLPIYVSYDSADVWANRSLFAIDEHGKATAVAGVPPDAFSEDGQLWGMPVFRWDILKQSDYNWWISRIRRNRELFDLIRIDHFRAFAAYWEVPAGETTARNGQWRPGPGRDFFTAVQDALGELPFIAEDLGDVDDTVFALRDEFSLPGMKVLQFAFGNDMPRSLHIPHNHSRNFLVYTGTHDNNTTLGWYRSADESTKRLLALYAGKPVTEDEVHWILARMAYGSVARIAILPMQDVLNLDESARMNVPASADSNWAWRLLPGQVNRSIEDKLKQLVELYNR